MLARLLETCQLFLEVPCMVLLALRLLEVDPAHVLIWRGEGWSWNAGGDSAAESSVGGDVSISGSRGSLSSGNVGTSSVPSSAASGSVSLATGDSSSASAGSVITMSVGSSAPTGGVAHDQAGASSSSAGGELHVSSGSGVSGIGA